MRELTNANGAVTDRYDYDAFGNLISAQTLDPGTQTLIAISASAAAQRNAYLYRGERFEFDIGQYYLRARFYNQATGRFWSQDVYEGSESDSASLHKYLYANSNPVLGLDPTGRLTLAETALVGGAIGIWSSVITHALRKENPISPLQGLADALIAGGIGAINGVVSFQVSFFLKQIGIASPLIKGALAGGTSGAVGQFLKELVSWVSGNPITFSESGGRIVEAAFGGFVAGGILSPIKVRFERPIPQWISHEGGIGSGASVVVLRYTDYSTVYSSAGLAVVPFVSVLQTLIKNEVLDFYESYE